MINYPRIGKADDISNPKERIIYRILEIFPGLLSWVTLIGSIILSVLFPFQIAIFIIIFSIFWLCRSIQFSVYLYFAYKKMIKQEKENWLEKVKKIKGWEKIYHLIVFPMYKESYLIVKEAFTALKKTNYPKEKMIVVLATEERAKESALKIAKTIKREFGNCFFKFLITCHPANLPGEIPGKCSNEAWGAKKAKEHIIDPLKIPYENIIFSSLDIDTCVFPEYFSCLAYYYLTSQNPTKMSYQPIPLFLNNISDVPLPSRIFSFSTTFWNMRCQARITNLVPFSSHSMSFKTLVEIGFHQTNVISHDSHLFWQSFLRYDGNYKTLPLYYPVSMDATLSNNLWKTIVNIYKQQRRWAYGVGDIAYFVFGSFKNKKIPLLKKALITLEITENHWSWATAPIMIFLLGWLPPLLGGEEFSQSILAFNLSRILSWVLTLAMIGLLSCAYISLQLLEQKRIPLKVKGVLKYLYFLVQWVAIPPLMILFSAFPALEAQTRWMLKKYLQYWATEKIRKS